MQPVVGVLSNNFKQSLSLTQAEIGLLSAVFYIGFVAWQIPVGLLLDRYGARRIMPFGFAAIILGTFLLSAANSFSVAIAARILMGSGASFAFVSAGFLITRWFPMSHFALMLGATQGLAALASAAAQPAIVALVAAQPWRELLAAIAAIGLIPLVLGVLFIRDQPGHWPDSPQVVGKRPETPSVWTSLRIVSSNPLVWCCAFILAALMGTIMAYGGLWAVPSLSDWGRGRLEATTLTSIMLIGFGIGYPVIGGLSDWIRRRKVFVTTCTFLVLFILMIILMTPVLPLPVIVVLFFLLGFFGGVGVLLYSLVCEYLPREIRGTAIAFINMSGFIGTMILQILPGLLLGWEAPPDLHHGAAPENTSPSMNLYRLILISVIPMSLSLALGLSFALKETFGKNIGQQGVGLVSKNAGAVRGLWSRP
nr:MFS transporter [Roseibium sp. RKSG952]